jgi:hypothetical protein
MNSFQRRRLRAPVLTASCGLALAIAATVVAGWVAGVPVAAIAAVSAIAYYWLGGTETDFGALIGSRPDERQTGVLLWVRALAAVSLLAIGTIGAIVSAALHDTAWPYAAIVALGATCFVAGLALYRSSVRIGGSDVPLRVGSRLDERQAAVVLYALQLAGIVMFLCAAVGGVALSGKPGADPLRILATAFALAMIAGFVILRPRHETHQD